uniref:SFRICE_038845 n=1 Tax=Spodoptera frugiperda TaxID=7108 RepID=A0A2H1W1W7_SPOFR
MHSYQVLSKKWTVQRLNDSVFWQFYKSLTLILFCQTRMCDEEDHLSERTNKINHSPKGGSNLQSNSKALPVGPVVPTTAPPRIITCASSSTHRPPPSD